MPEPKIPMHRLDIDALTDAIDNPTEAVQYCVVGPRGDRQVFDDQSWVADGRALSWAEDGAHVEQRTITITYGEWNRS